MEQSANSHGSKRREETTTAADLNLREWSLRAQISRDNTKSRRFSGSHIRSFREENARSFRSCITISSTASSPGYPFKEEIDPSTYSFTTALKALQARAVYNDRWECLSPDGFALNSKWNEAEKYICNPLSGEVPLECLSSKTLLSGRSFRNYSNRITMSAPLVYSTSNSNSLHHHLPSHQISNSMATKPASSMATPEHEVIHFPNIQDKKMESMMTRDMGTQSTPPDFSSSSSPSPPMIERSLKKCELAVEGEDGHFPNSNAKLKTEEKVIEEKETKRKEEEKEKEKEERKWKCSSSSSASCSTMQGVGCLSWIRKKQTDHHKHKPKKTTHSASNSFFLPFLQVC